MADIAPGELQEPFLHETVQRLARTPWVVHTPLGQLDRVGEQAAPAGVIFHVARCGSTLVSQMLKQHPDTVVYSEPLAINELLVPPHAGDRASRVAALRSLGARFSAHAGRRYVLKLSSWNTLFADLIVEAFPQTPLALCVRDPLEVAVSLQQSRPRWLHDDHAALFSNAVQGNLQAKGPDERIALFIAAFLRAAGMLPANRSLLLPYLSLPDAVVAQLAPHFGLPLDDPVRQRISSVSRHHSKSRPGHLSDFVPDAERKRAAASAGLSQLVETFCRPAYQTLFMRLASVSY
ncbi:hypothetical protein AACH06_18480 [Ideonella sp. DXS29W]|uniref:Sulfotransferase family protein n=1 Tax=Ideonella lacteola TaxID=2984193 RepID=A0ABU9BS66_9BURK